jgi:hypothetical protein
MNWKRERDTLRERKKRGGRENKNNMDPFNL